MISAVIPGTVGFGQGNGLAVVPVPPTPTPPEVADALGVEAHWLGLLPMMPGGKVGVAPVLGGVVVPVLVPPAEGIAPPPVLALALEAPVNANAARLGRIRWVTRKRSLSSAYGVS